MAEKRYDTYLEEYRKHSSIRSLEEYRRLWKRSVASPDTFWAEQARRYLFWDKEWDKVLEYDFYEGKAEWFRHGILNASYNCLDRHLATSGNKIAYYWEGNNSDETKTITYSEFYEQVNRFAAVLKSRGIGKRDRVMIYMPRIIELPVAMLACARIGAIHSVVFGGFGAKALADRIKDCGAKAIITVNAWQRAGKMILLKKNVDEALHRCPDVETVIVFRRADMDGNLHSHKEIWWHEAMADPNLPPYIPPEPMDAEDPLFILYTSGTGGKPRGVVHTHGGYLLYMAMTMHLMFDLKEDEIFWSTADFGWITGHGCGVYGLLLNGLTGLIFEGVPWYPDNERYWKLIEKYKVNKFYTAPAVIRYLARIGTSPLQKYDISSVRLLGTAGDHIDAETWEWFYHQVGQKQCPIVESYWQTETGGPVLTTFPGVLPAKPGSCSFPFFGVDPVILDDIGEEALYPNQEGVLCIRKPFPALARTIYGDHERFIEYYFSKIPELFFTGDGATQDEDGYFRIIGRVDDVINVSGHRLGTVEIEAAIGLHKSVSESAVVGFPHPVKGQGIYAFVVLKAGVAASDPLKKELMQLVRSEIGPVATPILIQWTDALPKTRSGKILRHILDKIAAGKLDELGDTSAIANPSVIENLINGKVG